MNKIYNILKKNKELLLGIVTGILLTGTIVYAATIYYASSEVSYSDTKVTGTLSATEVQTALDKVYSRVLGCICLDKNSTYTVGSTITYGGKSYTVVANNTNDVALAYNGTVGSSSGNTYNNANTYLATNFLNTDATLVAAKKGGCLVNQGTSSSPVYVTTNSNTNSTTISNEYWTSSGKVNAPTIKYEYTISSQTWYAGYNAATSYNIASLASTLNSSYSTTTYVSAGGNLTDIANTSTTVTYSNSELSSTSSLRGSREAQGYRFANSNGSASSSQVAWQLIETDSSGNATWFMNGQTQNIKLRVYICGGTNYGQDVSFTAKSSNQYYHYKPGESGAVAYNYSSAYYWYFAGDAPLVYSGSGTKVWYNANNNSSTYCPVGYNYTASDSSASIYYRPYIRVLKK